MTSRQPLATPRSVAVIAVALISGLFAGCSGFSPQRAGYEVLGNIDRKQCERQPWTTPSACANRPTYDDYQRARQEELGARRDQGEQK
jgi:hypothetical protein